jgi:hypothetical protein
MADSSPSPDDTDLGTDQESTEGTPRWVKVFGGVALGVVLVLAVLHLTGIGGQHGPGSHLPHATVRQDRVHQP